MRENTTATLSICFALALTATALAQPGPPAVDAEVTEAIKAIREASTAEAATAAYTGVARKAPDSVELRDAVLRKLLNLDQPLLAATAAQRLTQLSPNHAAAWAVTGYASADRHNLIQAFDAYARAAYLLPDDEAVMRNLGQLVAWYDTNPTTPKITAVTRGTLTLHLQRWKTIAAFEQGYDRINRGDILYKQQVDALQRQLDPIKERVDAITQRIKECESRIKASIKTASRMETTAARSRGDQANLYRAYAAAERKKQAQWRKEIKALAKEMKTIRRDYKKLKKQLDGMPKKRATIFKEADATIDLLPPGIAPEAPQEGPASEPGAGGDKTDARSEVLVNTDDRDALAGKDKQDLIYAAYLPAAGRYGVYLHNVEHLRGDTNTPIDIKHAHGKKTVKLDQRNGDNTWVLLGTFTFKAGATTVTFRTTGADGYVFADAIKFVPAE